MPLTADNRLKHTECEPLKAVLLSEGESRLIADELTRDAAIVPDVTAQSVLSKVRGVWGWAI